MAIHLKPISAQTVVITGATSGLGLATARAALARGASCVLVGEDEAALEQRIDELRRSGERVVYAVADTADADQLGTVTRTAVERFGGYDTWINIAGASLYGHLLDVDTADHRRSFDTTFWATVNGSLEAARHLREGGRGGAIVNVGSLLSDRALPIQGLYSSSKHAIKGFSDALRRELDAAGAPVSVSLVRSGAESRFAGLDFGDAGRPAPGHEASPYEPEAVARMILRCAERPAREIVIKPGRGFVAGLAGLAPRLTDLFMNAADERTRKSRGNRARDVLIPARAGSGRSRARRAVALGVVISGTALATIAIARYAGPSASPERRVVEHMKRRLRRLERDLR